MKNFILGFVAIQSFATLFGAGSFADVIFYNFDAGRTTAFYVQDASIYRVECPGMKLLPNGRADCNNTAPALVVALADVNTAITKNLYRTVVKNQALDPLSGAAVTSLMAGPPFVQADVETEKQVLLSQQKDYQDIVAKFGADAGLQVKINANAAALVVVVQKTQANANYAAAYGDFTPLLKTYVDMVANSATKVELVASKVKGSLAGSISQILAHYSPSMSAQTRAVNGFSIGDVILINKNAICHSCTQVQSQPVWNATGVVSEVTRTEEGGFVQLIVNGTGGWWRTEDVQKIDSTWGQ